MEKLTWHTETRLVKDLIPFAHNPRTLSKFQFTHLKDSLGKFDYVEIIAIQPDNTILAGHMRIKAMKALGWLHKEIEVRVPSRMLTEEEMREYIIRSNKNTGDWDFEALSSHFEMRSLLTWGFEPEELGIELEIDEDEEKDEEEDLNVTCATCGQRVKKQSR